MIELKRKTENKKSKLVGRGGVRGKTSGRGTKGQKARAGHRIRPHIRDIIKKLPKLRGRGKNINRAFKISPNTINVAILAINFPAGSIVSPSILLNKKLIRRSKGVVSNVKILAKGDIKHAISIYDCQISDSAKQKIENAGGKIY